MRELRYCVKSVVEAHFVVLCIFYFVSLSTSCCILVPAVDSSKYVFITVMNFQIFVFTFYFSSTCCIVSAFVKLSFVFCRLVRNGKHHKKTYLRRSENKFVFFSTHCTIDCFSLK